MTWLIGESTIFGYGMLISDIQVTFPNSITMDVIKKAYSIGEFIAVGFAGSVKIGFSLLDSLQVFLYKHAGCQILPDGYAWDPMFVATHWSKIAQIIFEKSEQQEKKLTSSLLMVAASPNELANKIMPWNSKIYIIRFTSPLFKPQIITGFNKVCSIGSGASVNLYKRKLREYKKLGIFDPLIKTETRNRGGFARNRAFFLFKLIEENPQAGISKHLHLITVERGSLREANTDHQIYPKEGGIINHYMPKVAENYGEFCEMVYSMGMNSAEAIC
jgi:hypothetical protein